jgi:hypothetical protein
VGERYSDNMRAAIEVSRPKVTGFRRDMFRRYKILVDDTRIASLKEGETRRVDVDPGTHRIQATIDWAATPVIEIEVAADEVARYVVRPGGTPGKGLRQSLSEPENYLVLERTLG